MLRVLRVAGPLVGDADAAGEADAAVDDQQLAVRAVVDAVDVVPVGAGGTCSTSTPASLHLARACRVHLAALPTQSSSTCTLTPAARALGQRVGELPGRSSPDQ